jgi:RHS repeat-associated protein
VAAAFSFASCVFFAGGWPTLAFDANNHISDGSVAYDAAGNIMQDAFNKYTYDSQNHMIASQSLSTGSLTCYFYDAYGRRVQKVDGATSCGYPITGGTSLYYVYDLDGNVIDEVSAPSGGTGNWTRQEIYAAGRHLATFSAATGQAYWDFTDWLGTERARASAVSGAVVETCTSLPWGDNLQCANTDQSPLHFTGKQRDTESGLDNFDARYLASSFGRFTSPDPDDISGVLHMDDDPQSWNSYAYVRNNPLSLTDPTGTVFRRAATDAEKAQGLTQVCDVTDSQYVNSSKEQQAAYDKAGYSHYDCTCDSGADKDAWQNSKGNVSNDFVGDAIVFAAAYLGVEGIFYPSHSGPPPQSRNVNLADQKATTHILDGDATEGGHRPGTGIPGKSEFPASWSDDKIMHNISDVATDPTSKTTTVGRTTLVDGTREGVNIRVVIRDGRIVTGYPTNLPRNP